MQHAFWKVLEQVKIFGNTEIESKITVEGIPLTKGAKASIEKAQKYLEETN